MPKIPLHHFAPKATTPVNVRADPSLLNPQFAAAARLGNAVAGLGEVAGDFAIRLQRAKDFRDRATVDAAMHEAWNEFKNGLNPNSNEGEWVSQWQKLLNARVGKATPKDVSSALKAELGVRIESFRVQSSGEIGNMVRNASIEKSAKAGKLLVDQAFDTGDVDTAQQVLDEMVQLGVMNPSVAQGMMKKGRVLMDKNAAMRLVNTAPLVALEQLSDRTPAGKPRNFTNLDENDRHSIITAAERNAAQLRSETFQGLTARMTAGELIAQEELDQLVARKLLSATEAKTIMRQQRSGTMDEAAYAELMGNVLAYRPDQDSTQTEYAALFARALGFPDAARGAAIEVLKRKADPKDVLNSPVARDAFEGIDARFNAGVFGQFKVKVEDSTSLTGFSMQTDAREFEKAMATKRRIEDATRQFLTDNPKATAQQVNEFISSVQAGEVARSGRQAILSGIALPVAPDADDGMKARQKRLDAILAK